jgi:formiminotetrahydrofolate cyclodeaminase
LSEAKTGKAGEEALAAFVRVLDPADNAVGGGTASAVAGAMGAALIAMVARLSVGKKGMKPESFYSPLIAEAEGLARELMEGGSRDARAFDAVMAAYRLPREGEEPKRARQAAIQKAMLDAAMTPLANARRCGRVLELGQELRNRSNPSAASDLSCAGHLARAALRGCLDNVRINLPSLEDRDRSQALAAEADGLERMAQTDT